MMPLTLFLFLIIGPFWSLLYFHMNFRIVFLDLWRMSLEFWLRSHWLYKYFGMVWSFEDNLPIHKHERFFHFCVFILCFVDATYHIYGFVCIDLTSHSWDKLSLNSWGESHLILVDALSHMLQIWFASILLRIFLKLCSSEILPYSSFSDFGNNVTLNF